MIPGCVLLTRASNQLQKIFLPALRSCGKAEIRLVLPALQPVVPRTLLIHPTDGQLFRAMNMVEKNCTVADSRPDNVIPMARQCFKQIRQLAGWKQTWFVPVFVASVIKRLDVDA